MSRPKLSDWEKCDELLDSGTKGWNPIVRLPELLYNHYPWTRDYKFGFFIERDLALAGTKGWVHLRSEHFDTDGFNNVVGLRFALSDEGGVLKFRENYLMIMPKDFRKRQVARQNQAHEDMVAQSFNEAAYAHPEDPEYQKMLKYGKDLSDAEVYQVKGTGEPEHETENPIDAPKRRGRPRKGE